LPPGDGPVRTLVVWCPDWPLVAAGVALDEPAAVFHANRVVACTPPARARGVARHQRRREAQARCPELVVLAHEPSRDARAFEPVAAAIDALTPRIELTRPGQLAFPTRGPSRYWGGDDALARRAHELAAEVISRMSGAGSADAPTATSSRTSASVGSTVMRRRAQRAAACIGIADGPFAAALAARAASPADPVHVVAAGRSPAFLAPVPLAALDLPELADVLGRLGLRCLGDLAALPPTDVLARFGAEGQVAWRLAAGLDERPPATEPPPPELTVEAELDPPAEQVEPAAFVARGLAAELHGRLADRGSACTRVVIGAETEHGEQVERVWRCGDAGRTRGSGWGAAAQALTAAAIADRVRWQLDGWLTGSSRDRPTAGISRIWLVPDDVVPATGRQLGFWGSDAATGERAARAVARIQGLLGPGTVVVPEWQGGRDPAEQVALIEAEAVDLEADRPAARPGWIEAPWPGRTPPPSPATVHCSPLPAEVADERCEPVSVSGRGVVSAPPARLRVDGGPWLAVAAWAGPWPVEERWWDPQRVRRRARFQLLAADGSAHMAVLEAGQWSITATYD
jgi:protein ImuB